MKLSKKTITLITLFPGAALAYTLGKALGWDNGLIVIIQIPLLIIQCFGVGLFISNISKN
jgi:hypothetical protein